MFILFLLLTCGESLFFSTKTWYNGTIGYEGLVNACQKEKPLFRTAVPCTAQELLKNSFWEFVFQPSWILDGAYNCVGYSSDAKNTMGLCVQTVYRKQIIPCSCDMRIPICCSA
ncbi:MAG TPA: hypothetical protein PKD85_06665 [Saprospiraceae bacterium]|nr:hypothetical protein [Saprospiraceae bacterium]